MKSIQGVPLDHLDDSPVDSVIKESIQLGLLPTPSVNSSQGEKRFAFTPFASSEKIELIEKHIYDKALLILSCVRYGQNFAVITKIANPIWILNRLLDSAKQHRIGPHSEIRFQYSTLVTRNIGKLIKADYSKYYFQLIPTEENKKAVRIALDLLMAGEPINERGVLLDQEEEFLSATDYKENLRSVSDLKRKSPVRLSTHEKRRLQSEFADILSRGTI